MSFANPTRLRIGMEGLFDGRNYRIAGRVVLGVEEGGETYYWNEFNLVTAEGDAATLVYEVTERGGEWRWFTLFEPQFPLTAEDAAAKRAGDPLNLEGTDVRVTLVEQSRVYHIEGQAPEGEEVGDVARYFNAEAPGTMIVVSWTGNEVECYRGADLSAATVKQAFNVEGYLTTQFGGLIGQAEDSSSSGNWIKIVLIAAFLSAAAAGLFLWKSRPARSAVKTVAAAAPDPALSPGASGRLRDTDYRLLEHAVVEVAQVGLRSERHEFRLAGADGSRALLIFGARPGARDWTLFTPVQTQNPMAPRQAGAVRVGQTVSLGGYVGPVTGLFQATVRRVESAEASETRPGMVLYGFTVQALPLEIQAEWDAASVVFYSGAVVPAKEVVAAFGVRTTAK